jgi:hypothetical protein
MAPLQHSMVVAFAELAGVAAEPATWLALAFVAVAVVVGVLAVRVQSAVPMAGLGGLLVSGLIVPVEFPVASGVFSACFLVTAFVCAVFALGVLGKGRAGLDRSGTVVATFVFMAICLVSFAVGQYPWFPTDPAPMTAQLTGLALFLFSAGLFLVVGHQVTDLLQLERLTWLFVVVGAVAVGTSLTGASDVSVGGLALTNAASIGSCFWTWLVALALAQALFNTDLSTSRRIAAGVVAAGALARGVFVAFSWASGWLPPLVAAGLLMLWRFPRTVVASGLLSATPALALAGPAVNAWMAGEAYSSMTRLEALRVLWQVIQRNPWLGFGPSNYYHYTQLFPILGWWVRFNSHNNYIDFVGQVGVVGLLAFAWFVVEVVRLCLAVRSRTHSGFERAYVTGAMAGLAGSLVSGLLADWVVPFTYNIGVRGFRSSLLFWFFLGGVLAMHRISTARRAAALAAVDQRRYMREYFPFAETAPGDARAR